MNSKDNPCYQCTERTITCHIDCPEYEKLVARNEQRKKIIQEKKAEERAYFARKQKTLKRWDRRR